MAVFEKALAQKENQLARVHAVWGLGQLAREKESYGIPLLDYVKDDDPEIVAQTAKVLGDAAIKAVGPLLVPMLSSPHPRVQFFGAQALGRVGYKESVPALLKMIEANNDKDLYLRHAAVVALTRLGQTEPIIALADSPNKSLRLAAVLVLRRWGNENVRRFLNDKDEYIVAEAARAINDDMSIPGALPDLAATLNNPRFTSEPLLRRAINANLRVGGEAQLQALLDFAKRKDASKELRTEALAALGTWASPSVLDRVDGRYRGVLKRDAVAARAKVEPSLAVLLQDAQPEILTATAEMMGSLGVTAYNPKLVEILKKSTSATVAGAGLGLGLALILELGSGRFRSLQQVERDTKLPVLAAIPSGRTRLPARRLLDDLVAKPHSEYGERIRQLRTALMFGITARPRSVTVTSSVPGEGKTNLTLALARMIALTGMRVVVVDGDFRHGTIHRKMGWKKGAGSRDISSVLNDEATVEQSVVRDEGLGFDVLPVFNPVASFADTVSPARFQALVEELHAIYDLVLIDAPSVLQASEAIVLARSTDELIYVVKWNSTLVSAVQQGLDALFELGIDPHGIVLTGMDRKQAAKSWKGFSARKRNRAWA